MSSNRLWWLALAAVFAGGLPAFGQITWNFTYLDATGNGNQFGFNDTGTDAGQTLTRGQLRRNSIIAAANYLDTVLDGRGTVNAEFGVSQSDGGGFLAQYGPQQYTGIAGNFQNGGMYQAARTNQRPFPVDQNNDPIPDGSGRFDFGFGWNYAGQNGGPGGSNFDMVTVAIHEIAHGLGFLSLVNPNGSGLLNATPGNPDVYSGLDRWLQRGNGAFTATSRLFNTDITDPNYGSLTGPVSTFTNTNDATTGLFFGGTFAREVLGTAVPMYAPSGFQNGSSVSHVNDPNAVMNPTVFQNSVRRFRPYEIAMMMDIGWNVYNWNEDTGGTGSWSTGSTNVANSRWRSDRGIVYNGAANGNDTFNDFSSPAQAPVLPVYGQVTANIALNFRNNSGTAYTSTNDLGSVRLSRLNFDSNNTNGGITIAGGTLNFGLNSNGSASVLVPKIVQNGVGAVNISSAIQTNTIATQTVEGVSFAGHDRIIMEGTGSGLVTISGNVTGTGGITKNNSSFNLVLSGTNTYTGTTVVNGGSVFVNGNSGGATGAVTVGDASVLTGNGTVGGAVTVFSGGTIEAGNNAVGTLTVNNNVTVNTNGTLRVQLGAGGTADRLDMDASNHTLDLKTGSILALSNSSFSGTTFLLADLNGTGTGLLLINGTGVNANTDITVFTSTGGDNGNESNGNVNFILSGFSLNAGDQLRLRRDGAGDLVLVFTPVPEPAAILVVCGLVTAGGLAWRRWKGLAKTPAA